jgi:hypothetical protein
MLHLESKLHSRGNADPLVTSFGPSKTDKWRRHVAYLRRRKLVILSRQKKASAFKIRHIEVPRACEEISLPDGKSKPAALTTSAAMSSTKFVKLEEVDARNVESGARSRTCQ